MFNRIGMVVAIILGVAALIVVVFFPDPLNRVSDVSSVYQTANSNMEPGLYTKAFVDDALERYDEDGRAETLAYYNSAASVDGEWYIFIANEDGTILAHSTVQDNIGRSLNEELGVDINGYRFGDDMLAATEEGRWVDYTYLNPARRNQQEVKHTWVVKRDGLIFGSGWYERGGDVELADKSDPAGYTKAFVEKAINRYDAEGREATVEYYNSQSSVDGEWYIFIIDEDDIVISHATIPENVGQDIKGPLGTDIYGNEFGRKMLAATEEGHWVDYFYNNPARDNRRETKHSWMVRHDGLIFGSGWYEVTAITNFLLPPEAYQYLRFQ